jgi:hypothetical protein
MRGLRAARLSLLLLASLSGCKDRDANPTSSPVPIPAGEAQKRTTEEGPVKATVTVLPGAPRLGDPIRVTLAVEAKAGVLVEMPPFGDALGRFVVSDYRPSQLPLPDGGVRFQEVYTLQAAMSGRQRIPPFRIEFEDGRSGQAAPDAGTRARRELLTDEIELSIASVLAGDKPAELRPAKGALAATANATWGSGAKLALAASLVALFALAIVWLLRRRGRRRIREAAHQVALRRLAALEARGWPAPAQADQWYVELSGVVRRYLEDRYAVRAPELTTEEFLREAARAQALTAHHRDLLAEFLAGCDRVKFAAYHPEEAESRHALTSARRFVEESRVVEAELKPQLIKGAA